MPYIDNAVREALDSTNYWEDLGYNANSPGEMNYIITTILTKYLLKHGKSYQTYNDLIGVLECAKLELYRRMVAPYEDIKIKENGDVYK